MKNCVCLARLAALPLAFAAAGNVVAQNPPTAQAPALRETVVTATRGATRADELIGDVTVLDRAAIEGSTARTLSELLARAAGIQMSANGGRGNISSVFIRGTESRHTILLVDGVRLGSATAGTPNWDTVPVDMIERIEILKGPASALYGSEGVGGVVQIFTRKGRAGFHPHATLTVGSDRHRLAAAGVSAGQGALTYSVGLQRLRDAGFSSTNPNVQFGNFNPDRDPFEQDAINASARYEFNPAWSVDAALLSSNGVSSYDDGPGFDSRSVVKALTAHAGARGQLASNWQSELRFNQGNDTANSIVAAFPGAFRTEQAQWTWQNNIDTPVGVLLAGLEQRVQKVSGSTAYAVTRRDIDSAFAGINGSAGSHSWQFNFRRDSNSQFGGSNTGFGGYGYRIAPAWRVHASHGTSFVAPSFNQLYFPGFGNPLLQPERGRNTDVGVTWANAGQEVKLVRFDNKIRGFQTNTTLPVNVPRVRIDGWTLGYEGRVGALGVRASVDSLDPRNEINGRQLPRRSRRQATFGIDHDVSAWAGATSGTVRLGGSVLHVGSRFDDTANILPLAAYTTIDLHADWQFTRDLSLQAKVNNLTDRNYETAYGYNQPGRGFFLTLRYRPK